MLKINNILAAVDVVDELSKGVLKTARDLAAAHNAAFHAVSVFSEEILNAPISSPVIAAPDVAIPTAGYLAADVELSIEEREKRFNELVAECVPKDQIASVRQIVGRPVHEIIEHAQNVAADIIVIGSHHRGFWGNLFEGSVSQKIASRALCGLFIVTEEFVAKSVTE